MIRRIFYVFATLTLLAAAPLAAQDDDEQLKIAALEALISAPADRALPLAQKALTGDHSIEVKKRALFVLSQINRPEAQQLILQSAQTGEPALRREAIRSIGIGGNANALAALADIYAAGDAQMRDAVLDAWLIAGDTQSVYNAAVNADNERDFGRAVDILGAMNAREELRQLRETAGVTKSLIDAYAIAGDVESLRAVATDTSDPVRQAQAIEAMGIVGGEAVHAQLVDIYRSSSDRRIRKAALDGMLIAGYDEGVLELYRASDDPAEKKDLLKQLVIMDSDAVWELIDDTLEGGF